MEGYYSTDEAGLIASYIESCEADGGGMTRRADLDAIVHEGGYVYELARGELHALWTA